MKLTSIQAKEMLKEMEENLEDNYWIRHSICVGDSAGRIAEKLGLDIDKAMTLGYM